MYQRENSNAMSFPALAMLEMLKAHCIRLLYIFFYECSVEAVDKYCQMYMSRKNSHTDFKGEYSGTLA